MRARPLVLVVDDSPDNRTMYTEFLELAGFAVLEADNGAQAIATVRSELPDAVVMDVGLPTIDGIEATRILRGDPSTKEVVIVAVSGHGADVAERAADAGVDRYLQKPCLPNVLVDHVRALLRARAGCATR